MSHPSTNQPASDRPIATQLKPGSKRPTGTREDVASCSSAGEPLFQIVTRQDFSAATYLLEIHHPLLALAARPGQFVIVQSHERGERIPLTIADFDRQKGIKAMGAGRKAAGGIKAFLGIVESVERRGWMASVPRPD